MKFGIRECANIVFRAKNKVKLGNSTFVPGQPVLYIDSATTSTLEQASTAVYAQGGRGNSRLIAWEGDKTLTFTLEDALLSPIGFSILSGAGLFKTKASQKVHFHMTSGAYIDANGKIDLTEAIASFIAGLNDNELGICAADSPLFVMITDDDGSITGELISGTVVLSDGALEDGKVVKNSVITMADATTKSVNVMVDYYINLPGDTVYEADITADTFAGSYYVEADTLFRQQATGKDLPANITFPNVKVQSNFTITMAGTGDPSTFTFTMDAFPGYTYFDKTKKVLCVMQIMENIDASLKEQKPVMLHNEEIEHPSIMTDDSATNFPNL